MGLIRAAAGAIGSTFADQWKEAIRCEDLGNEILMKKVTTPTGVITNKSTIIVGPGQCAVVYDNGRILDASAEEGVFTFDTSSSPSFFAGQFGAVFKEMWQRFTYNGATAKQQAVFYFNTKEILNNNFGTKTPVHYQDWAHAIPNQMAGGQLIPLSLKIRCFGKYTFKLENPSLFMSQIAGIAEIYRKDQLIAQIQSEVIDAFQNIVNELGTQKYKVPALELPSQTDEIKEMMGNTIFDEPIRNRGFRLISFVVEGVSLDEESEKKINQYELSSNAYLQQGKLVDSYADAVKGAANNANGAANGFLGIGMMNMASGGVVGGAVQGPWQQQNVQNANATQSNAPQAPAPVATESSQTPIVAEQSQVPTTVEPTQTPAVTEPAQAPTTVEPAQAPAVTEPAQTPLESQSTNTPKFCPNCGNKIIPGSKFCPECGNKL